MFTPNNSTELFESIISNNKDHGMNQLDFSFMVARHEAELIDAANKGLNTANGKDKMKGLTFLFENSSPSLPVTSDKDTFAKRLLMQAAFVIGAKNPHMDKESADGYMVITHDMKMFLDPLQDATIRSLKYRLNDPLIKNIVIEAANRGARYATTDLTKENVNKSILNRVKALISGGEKVKTSIDQQEGKFASFDKSLDAKISIAAHKYSTNLNL
jgi:hypothetical protein